MSYIIGACRGHRRGLARTYSMGPILDGVGVIAGDRGTSVRGMSRVVIRALMRPSKLLLRRR